jgi:glycosyltransferase involved in cell wall biosynthesis
VPPPVAGPYLLAVGAVTPRKGFDVLADAVSRLPAGTPPLLVAGPDGWSADVVHRRIAALGLGPERLRLLGEVSDRELDGLYRGATVVCHPSRAEGFGMPCLEAMRFGVPVVAGDIPPVREVCGDAARLVPVDDPDALAAALADVLADPGERARMTSTGELRAGAHSWDRTAEVLVELYRSLVG